MVTRNRSTSASTSSTVPDVLGLLEVLHGTDPAVVDHDELALLVGSVAQLRGYLDAYEIRCTRRTCDLAEGGQSESAASMLTRSGHHSTKDAARISDRNAVCEQLDEFEDALTDGRIAGGHLDAVADAMRRLDDDTRAEFVAAAPELLEVAANTGVDAFHRECHDLARHLVACQGTSDTEELDRQRANVVVKRWVDRSTGMHHTRLELDPIRDAAIWSGIDAHLARLRTADGNARTPWNQLRADAVVSAVSAGATRRHPSPSVAQRDDDAIRALRVPEITVVVDLATLNGGLHEHSICETDDGVALPVSTVRRLCCDAEIIPVVLGTDSVPLDLGRSVRTANRAQRRALRSMHRTCAHPDCTVVFSQCRAHHVRWWLRDDGPTDIDNLLPLCERHHHLVHEGRWDLTMAPDRTATWTRPDGVVHHRGTTIDRQASPTRQRSAVRADRRTRGPAGPDGGTHPARAG